MEPLVPIVATILLELYAYFRNALTFRGILAAALTAAAHAVHPWSSWFTLLGVFFLAGTGVTKLKQSYKSTLTASSESGPSPPPPGAKAKAPPRSATQVFCNTLPASVLILIHTVYLGYPDYLYGLLAPAPGSTTLYDPQLCLINPTSNNFQRSRNIAFERSIAERALNAIPFAILALYATAAADTFASELGIAAKEDPILLTNLLRFKITSVPKGTNGGVTLLGVTASALGAAIISAAFVATVPLCGRQWEDASQIILVLGTVLVGTIGGLLDSLLGAWCQASVVDVGSGKVVESHGGGKVAYLDAHSKHEVAGKEVGKVLEKRKLLIGNDLLSNNGVNVVTGLLIAAFTLVGLVGGSG